MKPSRWTQELLLALLLRVAASDKLDGPELNL
jgi:hypothetical protein